MPAFYVTSQRVPRPPSARTIFCDGSADDSYREASDLELSHWIPNRTPAVYKADTSTAICMRLALDPIPGDWELVINNHVDTDGILSVFTHVHAELALTHRQTIVEAAGMGDFMGWGGDRAQRLFQRLALLKARLMLRRVDPNEIYRRCFDAAIEVLSAASDAGAAEQVGLAALRESVRQSRRPRRKRAHHRPRRRAQGSGFEARHATYCDFPSPDARLYGRRHQSRLPRYRVQKVLRQWGGLMG